MRSLGLAFLIACMGGAAFAGAAPGGSFGIVPPHARLGAGESIQFKIVPPGHSDPVERIVWRVEGRGAVQAGSYRAPYVIPAAAEEATVIVFRGPRGAEESARATVELTVGTLLGADECLGAGQQWDESGCAPGYTYVEELPEAITKVPPRYPPSARARKLEGTVVVNAIVCRSGRVLDATARGTPSPELVELATEAARQWVFKPAEAQGQPVACVVAIPIRFPPP